MKTSRTQPDTGRSAFTLLELLAVITVISILLALILPALSNVFGTAHNAEVSAEFSKISTAITSFKSDHGDIEPWSYILFDEAGVWRDTSNATRDALLRQSQTRLRRLWPQFTFGPVDLDGNGMATDIEMTGSECLVFFLGGMRRPGTQGLFGFSRNPIMPFTLAGENREDPYFEFNPDQLVDTDGDNMLEYVDKLPDQTLPIIFVSGNNGQGYSKIDGALNFYVQGDGKTPWQKSSFQLISPGADGDYGFLPAIDSAQPPQGLPQIFTSDTKLPLGQEDNITNFATGSTLGSG